MKISLSQIASIFLLTGLLTTQPIHAIALTPNPTNSPLSCAQFFNDRIDPGETAERDRLLFYLASNYADKVSCG